MLSTQLCTTLGDHVYNFCLEFQRVAVVSLASGSFSLKNYAALVLSLEKQSKKLILLNIVSHVYMITGSFIKFTIHDHRTTCYILHVIH